MFTTIEQKLKSLQMSVKLYLVMGGSETPDDELPVLRYLIEHGDSNTDVYSARKEGK